MTEKYFAFPFDNVIIERICVTGKYKIQHIKDLENIFVYNKLHARKNMFYYRFRNTLEIDGFRGCYIGGKLTGINLKRLLYYFSYLDLFVHIKIMRKAYMAIVFMQLISFFGACFYFR